MKKQTVLITGASRGIGRGIALRFADAGNYNIIITCRRSHEQLIELQNQIIQSGSDCLALTGDAGSYEDTQKIYNQITDKYTGIDILINNAGISHIGLLSDMTPLQWNQVIQTNLTSAFNFSHCCIPYMVRQHQGKILNISSVWGNIGASCEVAYSASKGGINAFTKALAKELAPSNIQVNAIACGVISTAMNQSFHSDELDILTQEIPAGRFATPEETADFVYSITTGHPYLTGQILTFDGGWT